MGVLSRIGTTTRRASPAAKRSLFRFLDVAGCVNVFEHASAVGGDFAEDFFIFIAAPYERDGVDLHLPAGVVGFNEVGDTAVIGEFAVGEEIDELGALLESEGERGDRIGGAVGGDIFQKR